MGRQSHHGESLIRLSGWISNRWLCPVPRQRPCCQPPARSQSASTAFSVVLSEPPGLQVPLHPMPTSFPKGGKSWRGSILQPTKAISRPFRTGIDVPPHDGEDGSPSPRRWAVGRWWPSFHDGQGRRDTRGTRGKYASSLDNAILQPFYIIGACPVMAVFCPDSNREDG